MHNKMINPSYNIRGNFQIFSFQFPHIFRTSTAINSHLSIHAFRRSRIIPDTIPLIALQVQFFLLRHQFIDRLAVHLIRYTTIHRANRRTLRLLMKSLTFRALVRNNIIRIHTDRRMPLICIRRASIKQREGSLHARTIRDRPLYPAFIDRIIRTLRLASAAVDTFFGYFDRHLFEYLGCDLKYLCVLFGIPDIPVRLWQI
jgi:hypothetical protein